LQTDIFYDKILSVILFVIFLKVIYMDYCKRLKELRVKNGYTQGQIAFILHTRQEQYSKYENGKRELPIRHLITLCCLYKTSSDYILGIEKFVK
jgi:hypothetical protein